MNIPGDVMEGLNEDQKTKQGVPEEMGNNSGPKADGATEKGDINTTSDGSYMGEMAKPE